MGWIGDGATAEGDFHSALTFAAVYNAPVILAVVNNQWAISSFSGIAGAERATFAARAVGYGIAGLRVDGNDALAVYAATRWAADRARSNNGPTLIEYLHLPRRGPFDLRRSDRLPSRGRGRRLAAGRPDRAAEGASDRRSANGTRSATPRSPRKSTPTVRAAQKEAEKLGILSEQGRDNIESMFDDVFAELPWHLAEQRDAALEEAQGRCSAMAVMNMIQAINSAHKVMMERDPDIVVFGEDVGYFGGVFRATEGLQKRVRQDPRFRRADLAKAASSPPRSAWRPMA